MALDWGTAVTGNASNVSSKTVSFTTTGKANNILVVGSSMTRAAGTGTTGVTWDSNAMTKVANKAQNIGDASLWYYIAPATKTANVVATYAGTGSYSALFIIEIGGVNQSSPFGLSATAGGASTTPAATLALAADTCIIDVVAGINEGGATITGTPAAGQTEFADARDTATGVASVHGSYDQTDANTSWTLSASVNWAIVAAQINIISVSKNKVMWFFMKKAKEVWDLDKGIYRPRNTGLVTI